MTFNIIVTGVTEQPVYWTMQMITRIAINRGKNVYTSGSPEARSGKAVLASVRFGEGVLSPVVSQGDCQLIIGLEPLESVRIAVKYYTPKMQLVSSSVQLNPVSVTHGRRDYPEIKQLFKRFSNEQIICYLDDKSDYYEPKLAAVSLISKCKLDNQSSIKLEEIETALADLGEKGLREELLNLGIFK